MAAGDALTDRQRALLDFERHWCRRRATTTKAEAIRAELSLSRSRYHAVLAELLDSPAALAHDPLLVRRLRRRRAARRRARFTGEVARRQRR